VSPAFPTDNPAVQSIPLRKKAAREGIRCTVSGWGQLGENEKASPHNLQLADLYFIPYEKCRSIYENNSEESIQPGMNCAVSVGNAADACRVSTVSFFT
jgi:hypothetical protein